MKLRAATAGSPGLAAAAVAALALGIGITALMFAIVDGTVRRGLPVPAGRQIVHLDRVPAPGEDPRTSFRPPERELLAPLPALSGLAAYANRQTNLAGPGLTPRRWDTALVTSNTFQLLGVAPALGWAFDDRHADGAVPLLISDTVWREQFGADPAVVGRGVTANREPAVIVGVMAPGFRFPFNQHVWAPLDERQASTPVRLWGRLAPGHGAADAEAALTTQYQNAEGRRSGARIAVAPFTEFILMAPVVQLLQSMFLAGVGVLVIACVNVANLLLARGLARRRDFAIASALGASRARLVRERLIEGLALAVPGAILGTLLTYAGAAVFTRAIAGSSPPYWVSIVVDARVLGFVAVTAVAAALAAAALPAWRTRGADLSLALNEESRGATSASLRRITAALAAVEVALAACVLIAGGLMGKGIAKLAGARYDFAVSDVVTGRVSLPARSYPDAESRRVFYRSLHDRLQELPGARAAALGSSVPFAAVEQVPFALRADQADPAAWPRARLTAVSPGYFGTLGRDLIGGRDFESADREGRAPVAIVNLSFALKFAPRQDLIGRTVVLAGPPPITATIIGIAPDLFVGNPRGEQQEAIYIPLLQRPAPPESISVLVRAQRPGDLERDLRAAVASLDPELPIDRVMTLAAFREAGTWFYRVFGMLFLVFGMGALVLALVGLYAVMSFGVTRRRREIGTRMAFGATRADIARLFLLEGSRRLAAGLIAGGLLAAWLTPRLALFLFQVSPRDWSVYAGALAAIAIVGLSACAIPALRAARQQPTACLRED
jgi:putative ABC transport system permease protein